MKKLLILVIPALVTMLAGCNIGLETQKQDKTAQETQQEGQPAAAQEEDLPTSSDASSKQQIEFNREQQEHTENTEQTAPATIPAHENGGTEGQDMKQGMSDKQYIQEQYNGLIRHIRERARQGADADELHKLQSQLDEYATQHADELDLDAGWEQ